MRPRWARGKGQGAAPGRSGGGYSNIFQVRQKKVPPYSVLAKLGREPQLKVPSGTFNCEWPLLGSCRTKWRPTGAFSAILACSWRLLGPRGHAKAPKEGGRVTAYRTRNQNRRPRSANRAQCLDFPGFGAVGFKGDSGGIRRGFGVIRRFRWGIRGDSDILEARFAWETADRCRTEVSLL